MEMRESFGRVKADDSYYTGNSSLAVTGKPVAAAEAQPSLHGNPAVTGHRNVLRNQVAASGWNSGTGLSSVHDQSNIPVQVQEERE